MNRTHDHVVFVFVFCLFVLQCELDHMMLIVDCCPAGGSGGGRDAGKNNACKPYDRPKWIFPVPLGRSAGASRSVSWVFAVVLKTECS